MSTTEAAFAARFERHRGELQAHCYRMLGSLEDSEDLVQETFLRAWRGREGFGADGRGAFRAWLYRIATNACLDVLRRRPRRVLPHEVAPPSDPREPIPPPADLPWLQPYPDSLVDHVVARETIELAFIAAIQHLPPRQRAMLILRDVVGWSAKEAASQLDLSVAAANSALQRARETLRARLGPRRADWTRPAEPSEAELALLRRYVEAHERADMAGLLALLREDARLLMPPHTTWFEGRDAIMTAMEPAFSPGFGAMRTVMTGANGQPAVAHYLRAPGDDTYRPLALDVLTVRDGLVAEITSFVLPEILPAFGLPTELTDR
jgi:RNA polymerase sigma-70 factor (ECF subfamily)